MIPRPLVDGASEAFHLSASGYERLLKCETRFLRRHREGDQEYRVSSGPMFLGTLMHLLVQAFWEGREWGEVWTAEVSKVEGWEPGYEAPTEFETALWLMARYAEVYGPDLKNWEHVATEVPFELPFKGIDGATVKGYIDLILRHRATGELWVHEIKTMGKWDRCNRVPFDPQAWLYIHAARRIGYPVVGFRFDALGTYVYRGKTPRPARDSFRLVAFRETDYPGQLAMILGEYEKAAHRAASLIDGEFPPTKALSDACTYCPYYVGCAVPEESA